MLQYAHAFSVFSIWSLHDSLPCNTEKGFREGMVISFFPGATMMTSMFKYPSMKLSMLHQYIVVHLSCLLYFINASPPSPLRLFWHHSVKNDPTLYDKVLRIDIKCTKLAANKFSEKVDILHLAQGLPLWKEWLPALNMWIDVESWSATNLPEYKPYIDTSLPDFISNQSAAFHSFRHVNDKMVKESLDILEKKLTCILVLMRLISPLLLLFDCKLLDTVSDQVSKLKRIVFDVKTGFQIRELALAEPERSILIQSIVIPPVILPDSLFKAIKRICIGPFQSNHLTFGLISNILDKQCSEKDLYVYVEILTKFKYGLFSCKSIDEVSEFKCDTLDRIPKSLETFLFIYQYGCSSYAQYRLYNDHLEDCLYPNNEDTQTELMITYVHSCHPQTLLKKVKKELYSIPCSILTVSETLATHGLFSTNERIAINLNMTNLNFHILDVFKNVYTADHSAFFESRTRLMSHFLSNNSLLKTQIHNRLYLQDLNTTVSDEVHRQAILSAYNAHYLIAQGSPFRCVQDMFETRFKELMLIKRFKGAGSEVYKLSAKYMLKQLAILNNWEVIDEATYEGTNAYFVDLSLFVAVGRMFAHIFDHFKVI